MHYSKKTDHYLVLVTAALFVIAFIGAVIFFGASNKPQNFDLVDQPTIGNLNADVQIIVFQDLMCDDCKYFMQSIFPTIQEKYIKRNQVSFKMIPIAFLPYSKEVTAAALCLYQQNENLFWPFVKAWYALLPTYKVEANLTSLLKSLSLVDQETLDGCRGSDVIEKKIKTNLQIAEGLLEGQISVPRVLVNGKKVEKLSLDNLSRAIDNALERSSL
jgi:protein-disulfide isomerase